LGLTFAKFSEAGLAAQSQLRLLLWSDFVSFVGAAHGLIEAGKFLANSTLENMSSRQWNPGSAESSVLRSGVRDAEAGDCVQLDHQQIDPFLKYPGQQKAISGVETLRWPMNIWL
jgi:hypothetical protein